MFCLREKWGENRRKERWERGGETGFPSLLPNPTETLATPARITIYKNFLSIHAFDTLLSRLIDV